MRYNVCGIVSCVSVIIFVDVEIFFYVDIVVNILGKGLFIFIGYVVMLYVYGIRRLNC